MAVNIPTDPPQVIDASTLFTNTLGATYTASSLDDTVATVAVSGTMVSIMPVGVGYTRITITCTIGDESASQEQAIVVQNPPTALPAFGTDMLITVKMGGGLNMNLCTKSTDYTIDNTRFTGIGRMMGIGPVRVSDERDQRKNFEIKLAVDDTVAGLFDAIQQVGGAPVEVTYYNELEP